MTKIIKKRQEVNRKDITVPTTVAFVFDLLLMINLLHKRY